MLSSLIFFFSRNKGNFSTPPTLCLSVGSEFRQVSWKSQYLVIVAGNFENRRKPGKMFIRPVPKLNWIILDGTNESTGKENTKGLSYHCREWYSRKKCDMWPAEFKKNILRQKYFSSSGSRDGSFRNITSRISWGDYQAETNTGTEEANSHFARRVSQMSWKSQYTGSESVNM